MTKEEFLNETIRQAQQELQELKAEGVKKINYWQPSGGKGYCYVDVYGDVIECILDAFIGKKYRTFKTKQEAEKYAEYVKAEETLREAIAIANEGKRFDFTDTYQEKYSIHLTENKDLDWSWNTRAKDQPSFMYIKSEELAEELMREYATEFRTYLSY